MCTTYLQLGNKSYSEGKAMHFINFLMILKSDIEANRIIFSLKRT